MVGLGHGLRLGGSETTYLDLGGLVVCFSHEAHKRSAQLRQTYHCASSAGSASLVFVYVPLHDTALLCFALLKQQQQQHKSS